MANKNLRNLRAYASIRIVQAHNLTDAKLEVERERFDESHPDCDKIIPYHLEDGRNIITFADKLELITEDARQFISKEVKSKKGIVLVPAPAKTEDWPEDLFEMPDFPYFGKHGFICFAYISRLFYSRKNPHDSAKSFKKPRVIVEGVCSTDLQQARITLDEMAAESVVWLANFLEIQ